MADLGPIVKAYDLRGVVPDELDAEAARRLGQATAAELGGPAVVVGRDMRVSSPELAEAFMAGLCDQGVDAVDLGLCATEVVSYASGRLDLPGAMVTASHNPAAYNGFKLCRSGARSLTRDTGLAAIGARAAGPAPPPVPTPGRRRAVDLAAEHAAFARSFIDTAALRPLRVAVDAGNGMAADLLPGVLDGLPVTVVPRCFTLDGTFPHHPANPLDPANLDCVREAVVDEGCDLGLAFDGDADRVFCIDETGRVVASSLVVAALAERLLARHPGETILYNAICSRVVPEVVAEAGGRPVRTRVGHSYVKAAMAETDGLFAGEHSGHYYFRANYRADSGAIATLVILEALSACDGPMSALVAPYERYPSSGERSVAVADVDAALARVAGAFDGEVAVERFDGLSVDGGDWWANVRPSNTEPLLRVNVEARDEAGVDRALARLLALVDA